MFSTHPRRARLAALSIGLLAIPAAALGLIRLTADPADQPPLLAERAAQPFAVPAGGAHQPQPQAVEEPTVDFVALAAPPPEAHPPRDGAIFYEIEEGDTLLSIAEHFGLRAETLVWANDIANSDHILIGQRLRVPPVDGLFYMVQPGEFLRSIADRYGLDMASIVQANRISEPDQLWAGSELLLPGGRPRAPGRARVFNAAPFALEELPPLPDNIDQILAASWLRVTGDTALYRDPAPRARGLQALPPRARLERAGGLEGHRVLVRDPGDGRTRQAMTGWVDAASVEPATAPSPRELPRAYPNDTRMDISHVFVPYRSQLDGSPWALANCGPTALSMALEAFGIDRSPAQLRPEVLAAQGMYGHNIGTLMTALARVGEHYGIQALDLYEGNGIKRWTLDDIRSHLEVGHPVVVQVYLRRLPGYEAVRYYADHYIVVTGVLDDGFLYNDTLNYDGPGWDRVISGQRLYAAMDASDKRFRQAAFAAAGGA